MKKINNYLAAGLFVYGIISALNTVIGLPDFVHGMGLGIAISLELLGVYAVNHDLSKLRNFKMKLIKSLK